MERYSIRFIPAPGKLSYWAAGTGGTGVKPSDDRPQSMENAGTAVGLVSETACALAESATLADAAPRMLKAICETLGWEFGALWRIDPPPACCSAPARGTRRPSPLTNSNDHHQRGVRARALACRDGSGAPQSRPGFPTSSSDPNFPRAPAADRAGLHGAFGFPILRGDSVLAVMEFFSREIRQPDADLLGMLATVGSQIGLFVDRKRAEEELDRFFTISLDLQCIATFDGYFTRLNPAWERTLGYTSEELLAQPFLDFVHPDDREATIAADVGADDRRPRDRVREPLSRA